MIKLEIDSVHYDLDDALRSLIVDRIGGLDEFMSDLAEGRVAVSWEGGPHQETKVSAQVWGGGHHFEASDTHREPFEAIDQTRHKLEAQISKKHSKQLKHGDDRRE